MSFSEPLVWSGISGRSSTISNSALLAWRRASNRSRVTKPVRRVKMRSKRARKAALRCLAEPFEMRAPGRLIGKALVGMFDQAGDRMLGQGALAHVGERVGIDDVIAVAGAQQFEEVAAALRAGGAEPGEVRVADVRADAIRGLVASPGVVDRDPRGAR